MRVFGSKPVVCCGFTPSIQRQIFLKKFDIGGVNRAHEVRIGIGGKGANTSRVLHQLGNPSVHVGFVGGRNGTFFEQLLDDEKISYKHIHVADETRICQTIIEQENAETSELVEETPPLDNADWFAMLKLLKSLDLSGIVTISGKLPQGIPMTAYAEVVKLVNNQGGRVILDTQGEPLLLALKSHPFMVKINYDELVQAAGHSENLLALGARSALITNGSESVSYCSEEQQFSFKPPSVHVVNAVGSGDAVTAGVAGALNGGSSIEEALRIGVATGSANAMNISSGSVDPDIVGRLFSFIKL